MELKRVPIAFVFEHKDFDQVVIDYCSESGLPDLGSAMPALDWYQNLEKVGALSCCVAVDGDNLVGVVVVVTTLYPHFGKLVGSVESLWLAKDYRKGSAGLKLIREAKAMAKEKGAIGVYFGARFGSRLAKVYERLFTLVNQLFWAKL